MSNKKYLLGFVALLLIIGVSIFLISVTTPTGFAASPAENPTAKIEPALRQKLASQGAADFIVRFVQEADLSPAHTMGWQERGEFVYNALQETALRSQANAKEMLSQAALSFETFINGNELYVFEGTLSMARRLSELPEVESIRETRVYHLDPVLSQGKLLSTYNWAGDLVANNVFYTVEAPISPDAVTDWGITDTKADQFWAAFTVQGDGILVANIDTGVQWDHPALAHAFNCPGDPSNPACWEDPSNICGGSACDNNGHGTHTMGTMVSDDDPTLAYIAGMAPNANWIACKGCESTSCSDYALNTCADWIVAPGGEPANRPHVVNNSWGGGGGDPWYQPKVSAWQAAGIFPAFSAGNSTGCSSMGSPGDYQESFASTGHNSSRTHFYAQGPSTYGHEPYTKPNITAPAVSICSTVPTDSWSCGYSGTSMASPHSAGAVALLWSCNPGLIGQVDLTFQALQNTADAPPAGSCGAPPDGEGNYTHGYGFLNVLQAGSMYCGDVDLGYLEGYVTDVANGDPIEGATVLAYPAGFEAGGFIDATTDPTGYFSLTLVTGLYDVTASKYGYSEQTVTDVEIFLDTVTQQDFQLNYVGVWYPGPSPQPLEYNRYDGVFNPKNELIYFPGGRTGQATHDTRIITYDPVADVWANTGCNMNHNAANITAALIEDDGTGRGEAIYVVGGYDAVAGVNIDVVQRYYPSQPGCVVEDVTTDPFPDTVAGYIIGAGGVGVVNDKIFYFGGWENNLAPYFSDKTWVFNPKAAAGTRWTQVIPATLNPPRAYIQTAVQDGKIYAMGGIDYFTPSPAELNPTIVVEVFDPANPAAGWVPLANMPVASAEGRGFGFSSDTLQVAGMIYVAGGGDWPGQSAEVMEYDVASNTWNQGFPDLIQARRDHAGVYVPICTPDPTDGLPGMWVFGGSIGSDDPPFGDPEYFPFPCEGPLAKDFKALLTGSQVVPPVSTPTKGLARFRFNEDDTQLRFRLMAKNITDATAAHMHCAPPGVNGPVGITLWSGGPITIPGVGIIAQGAITAPDSGNSCGWLTMADVAAAMRTGDAYVQYHTLVNPAGEIRGQIQPLP